MSRADIRILVVADGSLHFGDRKPLGLGPALRAVDGHAVSPASGAVFRVTTAHRGNDSFAQRQQFDFDGCSDLSTFHQLWLFGELGHRKHSLKKSEIRKIVKFARRGGIFATGDHQNFGAALSGYIPRVRWMRRWFTGKGPTTGLGDAPGASARPLRYSVWPTAFETLDTGAHDDQFPKLIWPLLDDDGGTQGRVHEVFDREGGKAVRWLADHIHEGECAGYGDWCDLSPAAQSDFSSDAFPIAIAWAVAGPAMVGTVMLKPMLYPIACAYDGHESKAPRGRILTDSTWHHWVSGTLEPLAQPARGDSYAYFRNVGRWLVPKRRLPGVLSASVSGLLRDKQLAPPACLNEFNVDCAVAAGAHIREFWERSVSPSWALRMSEIAVALLSGTPARVGNRQSIGVSKAADVTVGDLALGVMAFSQREMPRKAFVRRMDAARAQFRISSFELMKRFDEQVNSIKATLKLI